ncbi:MAG: radical SAM protein [Alphaproteobacteria bacterium]|nr:radical SAM protein [Alphaproteobacteria bacterium]
MRSIPNIPEVYRRFPPDYVNDIRGWAFDQRTIRENVGKLLTLDIDFGNICTLNCPSCFRKNNNVDVGTSRQLGFDDLSRVILDAKKLGLRSVKFLGAGDPFENHGFLDFLRFLKSEGIVPLIFTKGHVIGDDALVKKYFGYLGISRGEDLVDALFECDASIMLGFNSFDDQLQAKLVGAPVDYVLARNRSLMMLSERGFAASNPTRLALAVNPITKSNVAEAFDIYRWGRLRNFYAIVTPTMISGRARKTGTWNAINPSYEQLIDLYAKIYTFNIDSGLQTLEQIRREGISAYAGGHPCNQVSTGVYVTLGGTVLSCPGSEVAIEGDIWKNTLSEIWDASSNRARAGKFNCGCIAKDGKSIPTSLYTDVMRLVEQHYTLEMAL